MTASDGEQGGTGAAHGPSVEAARWRGRLRGLYSDRSARRACACLAAGAILLGAAAAIVGTPGVDDPATARFRPGGMALERAGYVLDHDAGRVEGCLRASASGRGATGHAQLGRLFGILMRSATARDVLRRAGQRGVHVCMDAETDLLAYYFSGLRIVGLSTSLSEGGRIAFLAHELAHVPQHPTYSDNRYFPADDLVLLRRVREAAAEAIATRIAWELREAGYPEAWDEKLASSYADIARAFETALAGDASPGRALAATRAAFDRWFQVPWRLNVYDHMTVEHLERIAGDAVGLVPPRRFLTPEFLVGIGRTGAGNFLAGSDEGLLTDPQYAGNLSPRNAGDLERVLRRGLRAGLPADAAAGVGPAF